MGLISCRENWAAASEHQISVRVHHDDDDDDDDDDNYDDDGGESGSIGDVDDDYNRCDADLVTAVVCCYKLRAEWRNYLYVGKMEVP